MPKSLSVIKDEWEKCTKCSLGEQRKMKQEPFYFGRGVKGGIMFIGEGPTREDVGGESFTSPGGLMLQGLLEKFGLTDYYFTDVVSCHTCEPYIDPETGLQKLYKKRGAPDTLAWAEVAATSAQIKACRDRLLQEIYAVDPVLIVALGPQVAQSLLQDHFSIMVNRGEAIHIEIPGEMHIPSLTERRKVWGRKSGGKVEWPVVRNTVKYLMLVTFPLSTVMRKYRDKGNMNTTQLFVDDIRLSIGIYEKYLLEGLGVESKFKVGAVVDMGDIVDGTVT